MTCTPMSLVWSAAPSPLEMLPGPECLAKQVRRQWGLGGLAQREGKALISEANFGKQQPSPHFLKSPKQSSHSVC